MTEVPEIVGEFREVLDRTENVDEVHEWYAELTPEERDTLDGWLHYAWSFVSRLRDWVQDVRRTRAYQPRKSSDPRSTG